MSRPGCTRRRPSSWRADRALHDKVIVAARAQGGFVRVFWAGSSDDEAKIQEAHGATIRCLPFDQPAEDGICFYTGLPATTVALFARAY
jgi:hypothetical protein